MTKHLGTVAVTVVASLGLVGSSGVAHADLARQGTDSRPCVSMREYLATDLNPAVTLRQLERSWDVQGQRQRESAATGHVRPWYVYKVCGFALDEVRMEVGTTLIRPGEHSPGRETVTVVYRARIDPDAVCSAVIC